jgi:hypothetical protein
MVTAAVAILGACSAAPADRLSDRERIEQANAAPETAQDRPSADKDAPASPARKSPQAPVKPGDTITPSPWQPPAEVDPPHTSPGDSVEPVPPPSS